MLILTNPIQLYGRKIITDLALRSGSPDEKSFCNYYGLKSVANKFITIENVANDERIFEKQDDFDADRVTPTLSIEDLDNKDEDDDETANIAERVYSPYKDKIDFGRYYRRLEDIHVSYVLQYFKNVIYNVVRKANSNGYLTFNNQHKVQDEIQFLGDEGDSIELADIVDNQLEDSWSDAQKAEELQKLPYTIKRLHMLSCYCKVHMISFIIEYLKAKEYLQKRKDSDPTVTKGLYINDVLVGGNVMSCTNNGDPNKPITTKSKVQKAVDMFGWIRGYNTHIYRGFYKDYVNLVHAIDVLNIDIYKTNALAFTADFVDKLICYNLTPDSQYNNIIYESIVSNASVDVTEADYLSNTVQMFNILLDTNEDLLNDRQRLTTQDMDQRYNEVVSIISNYYMLTKRPFDKKLLGFTDGFFSYNGAIVAIPNSFVCNATLNVQNNKTCILHPLGYCVALTTDVKIPTLPSLSALSNLQIHLSKAEEPDAKWIYRAT